MKWPRIRVKRADMERMLIGCSAALVLLLSVSGRGTESEPYEERLEEIKQIRAEIKSAIYRLKDEGEREVLFERYVNFRAFKDIGPLVGYSEGHVYVVHRQGLEHIRITRAMIERSKAKKKKTH